MKDNPPRRMLRGGSWYFALRHARLSYRYVNRPDLVYGDVGFRVVRSSPSGKERKGKDDEK